MRKSRASLVIVALLLASAAMASAAECKLDLNILPEYPRISSTPKLRTNPDFAVKAYRGNQPFRIGMQVTPNTRVGVDPQLGIGFVQRF
jgi:hypothetical protein